jgi:hypothetical protein
MLSEDKAVGVMTPIPSKEDKESKEKLEKEVRFLEAVKKDLQEKLKGTEEELKLYDELKSVLRRMFPKGMGPHPFLQPDTNVPSEVLVNQEIPQVTVKVSKPLVETNEGNWRGRLVLLVAKGFFDAARKLTPVRERLQQDYGSLPNAALISNELVELLKMHFLDRKQENGQWIYSAYSGAKDRIKEAQS